MQMRLDMQGIAHLPVLVSVSTYAIRSRPLCNLPAWTVGSGSEQRVSDLERRQGPEMRPLALTEQFMRRPSVSCLG